MRRLSRFLAVGAAVLGVPASPLAIPTHIVERSPVVAAPAPAVAPSAKPGFENFTSCMNTTKEARVLLLIDESGSLKESDPDAERVAAATYLTNQFANLAERQGLRIHIGVAGFADSYHEVVGWTDLGSGKEAILDQIASFKGRDDGSGTDYWTALTGARSAMAKAALDKSECQVLVWFSDGRLDPTPTYAGPDGTTLKPYVRGEARATREHAAKLAETDLCRGGGVADQLRASGITVIGIGLARKSSTREQLDLMRGIATGRSAPSSTCGQRLDPVPGRFYLASNKEDLFAAFDRATHGGREIDGLLCQKTACPSSHTVVLDSSIRWVHIFAQAEIPNPVVTLAAPGGAPVSLPQAGPNEEKTLKVGAGSLTMTGVSDRAFALDIAEAGQGAWAGQWVLTFTDPKGTSPGKKATTYIEVSGDLTPTGEVRGNDGKGATIRKGDKAMVTVGLRNGQGAAVAGTALLGAASIDVGLVSPGGKVTPLRLGVPRTEFGKPMLVDLAGAEVGSSQLRLRLHLTTAPAKVDQGRTIPGTRLKDMPADVPFTVLLPADYPTLADSVSLGETTDQVDIPGRLGFTGDGCVWVDPASIIWDGTPDGPTRVTLTSLATSAQSCATATGGGKGEVSLNVTLDRPGDGAIVGRGTAYVAPKGEPDRAQPVLFRIGGAVATKPDIVTTWLVFALALLTGLGIPVGLLYLVKWRASTIPARALNYQEIPVSVMNGAVLRDGAPLALGPTDLRQLAPIAVKGARRLTLGAADLKTTAGISPFGVGEVIVSVPGAQVVTSFSGVPDRKARGRLPLAVHNQWCAWTAGGETILLVLVGADGRRNELVNDINNRLPDLIAKAGGFGSATTGLRGGDAGVVSDFASSDSGEAVREPGWGSTNENPPDEPSSASSGAPGGWASPAAMGTAGVTGLTPTSSDGSHSALATSAPQGPNAAEMPLPVEDEWPTWSSEPVESSWGDAD